MAEKRTQSVWHAKSWRHKIIPKISVECIKNSYDEIILYNFESIINKGIVKIITKKSISKYNYDNVSDIYAPNNFTIINIRSYVNQIEMLLNTTVTFAIKKSSIIQISQ